MVDGKPAELLTLSEDEDNDGILGIFANLLDPSDSPVPSPSLTLIADLSLAANTAPLPEQMASIIRPQPREIMRTRDFALTMENGDGGHAGMDMAINGATMDMDVINERVERGVWERWRIRSDEGLHPFHVHGCSFLIDQIEGAAASLDQQGWKDMVVVGGHDWSEIIVRFDHPATEQYPYMYHCHIREHEDRGMMGQFTVN